MKNLKFLFTTLLLLCSIVVNAHHFEVNGIYYNITDATDKTVEVTYRGNYSYSYSNEYTGRVVISESVTYNGTTYSITSIGEEAFSGCYRLASIEIPNSVTCIGNSAFSGCDGLTSVTIGNSVTCIGSSAFSGCDGLTSVTIGNSVTSIENSTFHSCSSLTSVTIPNSVTSIGYGAFYNCSGLTSITIPNSVTSIGWYAFNGCTSLTSVTIGNSVTSIGSNVFCECYWLTSITVASDNTVYDSRYNCNAIIETATNTLVAGCKNTIIPNSVTRIGNYAFENCSGLTSITIPNSVTSIGNSAFLGCDGLTSVTIGNSVTSIGEKAFESCSGLTSVTIGNSVTSIGNQALYNCSTLTSVTIPNSVTSIGWGAFGDCSNLTDVYCHAISVPATNVDAFKYLYPESMTLHVPTEAIESYRTTEPWSSFGTILALDSEIIEPEVKVCATPVISYNNGKLETECETEGAEFVISITSEDINNFYSNSVDLSVTYNISVYAMATGYENSETVNATLCWIENGNGENDTETNVINVPATAVFITSSNSVLYINCALENENIEIYTTNGVLIDETTIENGNAIIQTGLAKGSVAIVKIGEKSVKVILN